MENKEMAYRIAGLILGFDKLVFPDNLITRVEIISTPPKDGRHWVAYDSGRQFAEHYYVFVPGLTNWLQKQLEGEGRALHLAMIESIPATYEETPCFTEDELLVAIAAHEVRHRLKQLEKKTTFFVPATAEPALMGRVLRKIYRGHEFDAQVVGYLAAKEWRLGRRLLEDMARIVRTQPKRLR